MGMTPSCKRSVSTSCVGPGPRWNQSSVWPADDERAELRRLLEAAPLIRMLSPESADEFARILHTKSESPPA